jgi:hypothetical protein
VYILWCQQHPAGAWQPQVLQQLDGEGCQRVASVLRDLPHESVLVVGQADSYVTAAFDVVDTVVKSNGSSWIDAAP